ncbi:MAG: metallophosphoesterase family protein [Erythrobacter sp.]
MILDPLKNLFRSGGKKPAGPRVPEGERYYVVGDIHGRLDLFDALIDAIEDDIASRETSAISIILLGDLVDRGSDSAGVIRRSRKWRQSRKIRILAGNHEEMFLQSFDDKDVLRHFLKHGGRETLLSYGIPPKKFNALSVEELFDALPDIVPQKDRDYMAAFEEMIIAGDYLFVHAGIDPERPLDKQKRRDMLWIRERFLRHEGPLPKVVVHGHTIFDDVTDRGSRIGIDTGAFRTGVLTALVLEEDQKRAIKAVESSAAITIVNEDLSS